MQNFAKTFVRRAAGPVAAAATGATTAQARAPPAALPNVRSTIKPVEDEWVMTHVNGSQVLFQPFSVEEIDEGVEELGALIRPLFGSSVVINEVSPNGSDITDGTAADCVIEAADGGNNRGLYSMAGNQQELQLARLLHISNKMLRRPGLQREVVACMLEDPEVRDLMLTQCDDLDAYLIAAGIPAPAAGLLMPATDGFIPGMGTFAAAGGGGSDEGHDLIAMVVNAVSGLLEQRTGGALKFLGHWLRDRFAFLAPRRPAEQGDEAEGVPGRTGQGADRVMESVMVLAIAVVCMLVVRKPLKLRFA